MMAQLDTSISRATPTLKGGTVATPTSEEDLLSVRSDDSDADSECFVVINQASDDTARDNTLFAINSKRASPVEVAAEAVEELPASIHCSSQDLRPSGAASVASNVPTVEPQVSREGVVSKNLLTKV